LDNNIIGGLLIKHRQQETNIDIPDEDGQLDDVLASDRAEEVSEMLERTPSWIMRWGILSITLVVFLILLSSVVIKYPDTLEGPLVLTTNPLPVKLKALNSGRLTSIFVKDGQVLKQGDCLAEIENGTGLSTIIKLKGVNERILYYLDNSLDDSLNIITGSSLQSLGDGQAYYNSLQQNLSSYLLLKKERIYAKREDNLKRQMDLYHSVAAIDDTEKSLINEELLQADERFKSNEKLYNDHVISRQEYYDEAARLRQKKLSLQQQISLKLQGNITISDSRKQILDMEYDKQEKLRALIISIREQVQNIDNFIHSWKLQYLFIAPYAGQVHYTEPLQQNMMVASSEGLFAIVPQHSNFIVYLTLPSDGAGKVKKGQSVQIMLDKFPYNEYGVLEGKVNEISTLPQATNSSPDNFLYRVSVSIPPSLVTSYHIKLPLMAEMSGKGRIVTKDRNLFQRLISNIVKLKSE